MECTCGFAGEPWAEAELSLSTPLTESAEEHLFESLSGVRGVRGVRINVEDRKVLVSYDPVFLSVGRLEEVTERAGFVISAASLPVSSGNA